MNDSRLQSSYRRCLRAEGYYFGYEILNNYRRCDPTVDDILCVECDAFTRSDMQNKWCLGVGQFLRRSLSCM